MSDIVNEIYNEYKKKNKKHKKYEGFTMSDFINEDIDENANANANANADANANANEEEEENITFDSLRKEWDMSEPEKLVKESQNTSEKIVWTIGIIIMVLVGSYYFRKRIKLGAEAFSELFDKTQLWMVSSIILLLVSMFGYSNGEDPLPMLYIMVPVMIGVLILNEVLKKVIDIDIGTLSSSNTTLVSLLFLSIFCIVPTFFEVGVITPDNATLSLIWTFMIVASVFIVKGSWNVLETLWNYSNKKNEEPKSANMKFFTADNIFKSGITMDIFNRLYNQEYSEKYGGSIMLMFGMCVLLIAMLIYTYVRANIGELRANWTNERCKPYIMPFASLINENISSEDNFNYCMQDIISNVADTLMMPINASIGGIAAIYEQMAQVVQGIRNQLNEISNSTQGIFTKIYEYLLSVMAEVVKILETMKDTIAKFVGVIVGSIYSAIAVFLSIKSFFGALFELLILVIIMSIVAALAFLWLPVVGWTMSMLLIAFVLTISGTLIYIKLAAPKVFDLVRFSIPGVPKLSNPFCFSGDVVVKLKNGKKKRFDELKVGDELLEGGTITAFMEVCGEHIEMYNISDIIISGEHKIMYMGKTINVREHPNAKKISKKCKKLYCINNTEKYLNINNEILLDYDELTMPEYNELKDQLEEDIKLDELHKYYDGGFEKEVKLVMEDGSEKEISKINAGDRLQYGIKVMSKVEMNGDIANNVGYMKIGENIVKCSSNILLRKGVLNKKTHKVIENENVIIYGNKEEHLYHVVTEQGYFYLGGEIVVDYNGMMDNYLK
tara:strand:+ start:237 stop:2585 length:2349 start_codon:yes stop_codon:yes gene_type:complete